jgi:hypothetical protein
MELLEDSSIGHFYSTCNILIIKLLSLTYKIKKSAFFDISLVPSLCKDKNIPILLAELKPKP